MKLDGTERQEAARDRERLELDLSELPDYEHPHPPAMFSYRFKTFLGVGILMGIVFTVIHYFHVKAGWPW